MVKRKKELIRKRRSRAIFRVALVVEKVKGIKGGGMRRIAISFMFFSSVILLNSEVNAKFPWVMFNPAITGAEAKKDICDQNHLHACTDQANCLNVKGYWYNNSCQQNITCSDLAGYYEGYMSDNCSGYWAYGTISVDISSYCSFYAYSSYDISVDGNITNRQGSTFSSSNATTYYRGCGPMSITCTNNGASISCNYRYANGGSGSITNLVKYDQ